MGLLILMLIVFLLLAVGQITYDLGKLLRMRRRARRLQNVGGNDGNRH